MSATNKKRQRQRPLPAANAHAYTIADAMAMGLPGKSTVYKMIGDGRLETIIVGGRRLLKGNSVRRLLGADEAA
jgi:hypothetical protein